jgi:NDP-sugar pyrophosphorylase family protein
VSAARGLSGGIIAAGEGRRLQRDGWKTPKPLVRVGGEPLVARVLRNFQAAGIRSVTVIFNEQGRACASWVASEFPGLDLRIAVRTTPSSLASFLDVLARAPEGPLLVSTVDAWSSPDDFTAFVAALERVPPEAVALGVTGLVADEKPLWVRHGPDGRVRGLGGESGDCVTAGLYRIPPRVRSLASPPLDRLRDYLGWLLKTGEDVRAVAAGSVVDVDRAEDVALAEGLARRAGESGGPA